MTGQWAEAAREMQAEQRARKVAREAEGAAFVAWLDSRWHPVRDRCDGVLRDLVEHHRPHASGGLKHPQLSCEGCDEGAYAAFGPSWPCSTFRLIAAELGVELPADPEDET